MSKDQLSWEQLFIDIESEALPPAEVETMASVSGESTGKSSAGSTPAPRKRRTRAKKSVQISYSSSVSESRSSYRNEEVIAVRTTESAAPVVSAEATPEAPAPEAPRPSGVPGTQTVTTQTEVFRSIKIEAQPEAQPETEIPTAAKKVEPQIITVSQLNRHIREMLEGEFPLLWLKGEISNFKAHTSGHFYFSLKDSKAQINAVMFRGFNSHLKFRPEDGMEVLVRGKVTVFEPRGNYQIFCETMEPVGAGALQQAFEQLKSKLNKEGLFSEARKRPLPTLPKHIAIVTSPTGAAIRDMLNVLRRRFKGARITVIPCKVQGDQAPREIIAAIGLANRLTDVDVMIVGRGGGSIEDLWAFNDEGVARAIVAARVPVISAVGHEVDFTIADFVADLRAPTPSAAAELVVRSATDLLERIVSMRRALRFAMLRGLNGVKQEALALGRRLVDPQRRIQDAAIRCDELMQRLQYATARRINDRRLRIELLGQKIGTPAARIQRHRAATVGYEGRLRGGIRNTLSRKHEQIARNAAVLDSLSPLKVLDRGYSMVVSGDKIVTNATSLAIGQTVTVRMCKGSIDAHVAKIEEKR